MNKALTLLATFFFITACDQGNIFNGVQLKTDSTTRLETSGPDAIVYEFTPKTAPNMQCIFLSASSKGGLVCFKKEKIETNPIEINIKPIEMNKVDIIEEKKIDIVE